MLSNNIIMYCPAWVNGMAMHLKMNLITQCGLCFSHRVNSIVQNFMPLYVYVCHLPTWDVEGVIFYHQLACTAVDWFMADTRMYVRIILCNEAAKTADACIIIYLQRSVS